MSIVVKREKWVARNISNHAVSTGIEQTPALQSGGHRDLLSYATKEQISQSKDLLNAILNGFVHVHQFRDDVLINTVNASNVYAGLSIPTLSETDGGYLPLTGGNVTGPVSFGNTLSMQGNNFVFDTVIGTQFGTASTQKISFFGHSPTTTQPVGSVITALTNLGLVSSPTIATSDISGIGSYATLASPTFTGTVTTAALSISDGSNVTIGSATGTKFGSSASKIAFFGQTASALPTSAGNTNTITAGSITNVFTNTTFTGGIGSTAYTVGDIVAALKKLGLITT